jgi:hypothetical protein
MTKWFYVDVIGSSKVFFPPTQKATATMAQIDLFFFS